MKWELYKQLRTDLASGVNKIPVAALFPKGPPDDDLPECFLIYQRMKRGNRLWWPGGLADQPHIFMLEMDACAAGEDRFQHKDVPYLMRVDKQGRPDGSQ